MHMQDAFFVDQQKIGTWKDIGYTSPTSTNFKYEETEGSAPQWKATAQFDTDGKCTADEQVWKVSVAKASKTVKYTAEGCTALTPNFDKIGSGS